MQEHHLAVLVEIKQHPRHSVLGQVRPHLVNTTAHGAAYRHPHGPAKLNRLDVFADTFTILAGKEAFQPFPNWLPAGLRPIKDGLEALPLPEAGRLFTLIGLGLLTFVRHKVVYHIRSTPGSKAALKKTSGSDSLSPRKSTGATPDSLLPVGFDLSRRA